MLPHLPAPLSPVRTTPRWHGALFLQTGCCHVEFQLQRAPRTPRLSCLPSPVSRQAVYAVSKPLLPFRPHFPEILDNSPQSSLETTPRAPSLEKLAPVSTCPAPSLPGHLNS